MQTLRVIPTLKVLEQRAMQTSPRGPGPRLNELALLRSQRSSQPPRYPNINRPFQWTARRRSRRSVGVESRRVLRARVRVTNEVLQGRVTPRPGRHVEGGDDKISGHGSTRLPTHEPAAEDIDDEGDVDHAGPRRAVGEVGNPELIGRVALNSRFTRSGARRWSASAWVVKRFFARLAPRMPWRFMRRA